MAVLKEKYTTRELIALLSFKKPSAVIRRGEREGWRSEKLLASGGGYLWIFASMPEATQSEIRTAEGRIALEKSKEIAKLEEASKPITRPVTKEIILKGQRKEKALAKADLTTQYLSWQERYGRTVEQKEAFIDAYLGGAWPKLFAIFGTGVSWKSLERWKNQLHKKGVAGLADKRGIAHRGRTMLTQEHYPIILGNILNPNKAPLAHYIRRIQERCKHEDIEVPSDATIRRFVDRYMSECFDEYTLWREGKKAWNDKCAISILRDWNCVQVGDVVIADGHVLNFETINPETGKPKRMTLLLFYDGASNAPLGWEIMPTENTACISSAFRRACIYLGKYPRVIYIDNGKAFRSKFFKGTSDFEQAGFLGLYRELGCEVTHAWRYHGQSKTIERFFGTLHDLEVSIPSYTGNCIAAKPPRMHRGEDLHRRLYKQMGGKPLTLEETHIVLTSWFEKYMNTPQHRTHLKGKTPLDVLEPGRGPGVDLEKLNKLMLQKTIRTVSKDGIRHQGKLYWHEALRARRHEVVIRYDDQLSPHTVLVYTTEGDPICEARDRHHYKIAAGIHPAARVLGTEEEQKDLSDAIALKGAQWENASKDMKHMLEHAVLPEVKRHQKSIENKKTNVIPLPVQEVKVSKEEIEAVEAAKAKARAEIDTQNSAKNNYTPSVFKRFKDELEKYDYLFIAKYEKGAELVFQDEVWMQGFESTDNFKRNYARRYEQLLQLYAFREQVS